jgi:hypothetical protein
MQTIKEERPEIDPAWCEKALQTYIRREVQLEDGRIRFWIFVPERNKYLRVITLSDGETLHNAFFDRGFTP